MAMMQQYGNNLSTPYGTQDYSPFFNGQNNYRQNYNNNTPTNNLLWVQGIEGAKALMLPPNAKIICLDSEIENRAYIKIADELGATKLRKFELHEITDAEVVKKLVKDVKKELDNVSQYKLNKFSMNYDMTSIVEEQEK